MIHSILGGGVTALCCATALSDRGLDVEVIVPDGAPEPASRFAGGMLAPFCEGESAPERIVAEGQAAVTWWATHLPDVVQRGTLVVAPPRDVSELERFARATRQHEWVAPGDLEPDLAGRFARGLFFPGEAHLDPRRALSSLESRLKSRGVWFRSGMPRGRIIDCRGLASHEELADLRGVRGEMLIVHAPDVTLTRPVRLLHPRFPCYIVPRDEGRYMIGATMVESARRGGVTARAAMELLSAAYTLHPGFAEAEVLELGAGLRPSFPDNIPAIRHAADRIHVNGMYRHGFLMAPVCAQQLATELVELYAHAN